MFCSVSCIRNLSIAHAHSDAVQYKLKSFDIAGLFERAQARLRQMSLHSFLRLCKHFTTRIRYARLWMCVSGFWSCIRCQRAFYWNTHMLCSYACRPWLVFRPTKYPPSSHAYVGCSCACVIWINVYTCIEFLWLFCVFRPRFSFITVRPQKELLFKKKKVFIGKKMFFKFRPMGSLAKWM